MHFTSFDPGDPTFEVHGFALSFQVVTLENVYGLDPAQTSARFEGEVFVIRAAGFTSAGGQRKVPGAVILRVAQGRDGEVRVQSRAKGPEPVRCVKLLVGGLDTPLRVVEDFGERPVSESGEILAYPNRLATPLLRVRAGETLLGVRVEDDRVREKRFALSVERIGPRSGQGVLECILDEDATRFEREYQAPNVVLARGAAVAPLVNDHLRFLSQHSGLVPWRERTDVPAYAQELALVLTLHGMHWTGRVFLDYAAMLEVIRFVAERIDGRRVLAYLPGWEGRYYWQYGEYRPEPGLGGEAGFATLCREARALGVHVMPMFGGNCVNAWLPRFDELPASAYLKSATGNRFHGNQPDWDFSRTHDTGWQAWLNPGHPAWRDDLVGQIEALARRFGFDGVFLDTIHVFVNDPDHAVHPGIVRLVERLRRAIPGVLLAAEHDFDALLRHFDLFQRAYWGQDPSWTAPYALRFAHLCEGEPEGRTGVHEFGSWRSLGAHPPGEPRPGYLPTIAFQDDTLARSRPVVERIIAEAAKA